MQVLRWPANGNPMTRPIPQRRICSRGHVFYKSSACPVCPKCWSGAYRKQQQGDLPDDLSAPAIRGLRAAKIVSLKQLSRRTEEEVAALHGVGPRALLVLRRALHARGSNFRR